MHKKLKTIRWLLVIPVAIFSGYVVLITSNFLLSIAASFCPSELMISNQCMAEWYEKLTEISLVFIPSLAAMLIIIFSTLTAPNNKNKTAIIIYILSILLASYAVYVFPLWGAFYGFTISGTITMLLVLYLSNKRKNA